MRPRPGLLLALLLLLPAVHAAARDEPGPFSPATTQLDFADGLRRRGLYEDAAAEYARFLADYPADARTMRAVFGRAESFFALARYPEAAKEYYRYLTGKAPPDHQPLLARMRYGACLFEMDRAADAVKALTPLLQLIPPDTKDGKRTAMRQAAEYYIGRGYRRLGDTEKARAHLARVDHGELAALAAYALAEMDAGAKRYAEAAGKFARIAEGHPRHELATEARIRAAVNLRLAGNLSEAAERLLKLLEDHGEDDPVAARALYELAWVRQAQHDTEAASRLAQKLLADKVRRFDKGARYLVGLDALARKDYERARQAFAQVVDGPFAEPAALKNVWALHLEGRNEDALAALERYENTFPALAPPGETAYLRGRIARALEDLPAAEAALLQARKQQGEYHDAAAFALAQVQEKRGRFADAARAYLYFTETFKPHAQTLDALAGLGRSLSAQKQYEAALPVYARLYGHADAPTAFREHALAQQAVCYYHLRQFENMKRSYQKLLQEFPESAAAPEAYYWLAWQAYSERGYERAAALYEALMQKFPQHELAGNARYRLAMSLYQAGKHAEAAAKFYAIVAAHEEPELPVREMLWLGRFYMHEGDLERAAAVFETLLARGIGGEVEAIALFHRGEVARQRRAWAEALSLYDQLLARVETLAREREVAGTLASLRNQGRYGAAVCLRHLERYDEAAARLAAMTLHPEDPFAAYLIEERGNLAYARGECALAAEHLMRVGLLADDAELAGRALLKAGAACEAAGEERMRKKARICYEELAGLAPESYGKRYPQSPYVTKGKAALAKLIEMPEANR